VTWLENIGHDAHLKGKRKDLSGCIKKSSRRN